MKVELYHKKESITRHLLMQGCGCLPETKEWWYMKVINGNTEEIWKTSCLDHDTLMDFLRYWENLETKENIRKRKYLGDNYFELTESKNCPPSMPTGPHVAKAMAARSDQITKGIK